jgi:acetyltransferase-like isoleucine patch superfamily enzyme
MTRLWKLLLYARAIPKTILFNFWYFPPGLAIRFPVIVSHRVWLCNLSGKVILRNPKVGGIRIGFGQVGVFDWHRSRSIWEVTGTVEFAGKAWIGHGSKLSVHGRLELGNNFTISAESQVIADEHIVFGDDVLMSWDVLVMDTDKHVVYDENNVCTNPPTAITIGNRVWIGCRSLILKGVRVADGCIVAAGTVLSNSFDEEKSVIGASPNRILKRGITWK